MEDVKPEGDHRNDVEEGDPPDAKAGHDIDVDILFAEHAAGFDRSGREMQDVKDDENQK